MKQTTQPATALDGGPLPDIPLVAALLEKLAAFEDPRKGAAVLVTDHPNCEAICAKVCELYYLLQTADETRK